jgi:gliding motility-associated-like protein
MKRWSKLFPALLMILAGSLFTQRAAAQCKLTLVSAGHDCVPAVSAFLRTNGTTKTVSNYAWDFGDGNTGNDTTSVVNHQFTKTGCFTVSVTVNYTDGTSCKATAQKVCIYGAPKAVINLPTNPNFGSTQCYRQSNGTLNKFCFTESSIPGSSGAKISDYIWNFGDGDTSTLNSPCHSYQAPGTYTITLRIKDTNGCVDLAFKNSSIIVLKDIKTKFTMNGKTSCNSATFSFKNTTDTSGLNLKSFYWNFGDGSAIDSVNYNVASHVFYPGTYYVKLTIKNSLGCTATDSQKLTVDKFQIKAFFKDTICWADAANNGMTFIAAQQAGVVFWQWNFGDPNSQNLNIANYAWTASHKFVGGPGGAPGGPGNYCVHFLMINSNPNCGKNGLLDTFFTVHIKGPMAMINLPPPPPFPPNNYVAATPMPNSDFTNIINNKSSCGPQTIKYSVFSKNLTATRHVTYKYCNADTLTKKVDTATDCYGKDKKPYVSNITLKPTDSTVSFYKDSTEVPKLWTKGIDAAPSVDKFGNAKFGNQLVYYPSGGSKDWNNIHDSNMVTCKLPNLVRFTNNSIKYRLRKQMDDNTFQNVLDPADAFKDTCRWKNYPMSSDSLTYFWKFNDPSGVNCTSSVSNKNWDCNFSTLAAPYHYYRGKKGFPNSRCQNVNLTVTDAVMNCADSTILQLKQGPPQAYWDRSAYCKMTWEMQVTQLAPKGQPGPNGPPLIGFQFSNQPNACTGSVYPFRIDLSQTLPTCGATNWWAVWDSANVVKYKKCTNPKDSTIDYGFLGDPKLGYSPGKNGYPAGAPSAFWNGLPWLGNYWYELGDSGCKTVGIVLQNGTCFDTAWYHDYICFNKLVPEFKIYNMIPPNGSVRQERFVDNSTNFHGHVCQQGFGEGVNLRLYPLDTNQKDVTSFKYGITRLKLFDNPFYTNSGATWYYDLPIWPDSAVLNPFSTWNDSIKQIAYKVYYIDTPHLYIILNQPGLPPHRIVMNFPLYKDEIDSLNARKHVNVSLKDERARRLSALCTNPYVTLFVDKVVLKSSTQVLNLKGFGAVDSVYLPYPGAYRIQSQAANLQGCLEPAQYDLIYGHFAMFDANNDSIICLGKSVKFHYYVRYWSTTCPPPPGGGAPPEVCLNGYDEGMPAIVDFAPWDSANPTSYRNSLVPNWSTTSKPANYQPEQLWWNFGDNPFFNKVPNGSKITHTYAKAGVYSVSMRTIDWRSCAVTTVRRNLIKVIQPIADFSLVKMADTLNYCAPKSIRLVDKTTILGSTYKDKVLKKGALVDSTYVVDSVASRTWFPGDGRSIVKTTSDSVIFDYKDNGLYTVTLTVQTDHGCGDSKTITNYIRIIGPTPKFAPIGNLSGCAPFVLHVRNINTPNVSLNVWHFGDDSIRFPNKKFPAQRYSPRDSLEGISTQVKPTNPPGDSIVVLPFQEKHGHFRVYVTQTDTFHDLFGAKLPPCTTDWPKLTDSFQIWVTIFPHSPVKLASDTLVCVNAPVKITASSDYGEYHDFSWDYGNGKNEQHAKDSFKTVSYTLADYLAAKKDKDGRAIFKVTLHATSDSGCSRDTFRYIHVEDSKAEFGIDSSIKITTGAAKFNFDNKSVHAVKYIWNFGDSSAQYVTTDSTEIVHHEYGKTNQMGDTITEGNLQEAIYKVKLTTYSPLGCMDTISHNVIILRQFRHYNVFTPGNGDGHNDKFVPGIVGSTDYNLKIYNRWGQKVFETSDKNNNWDGTANGQPCPEGAYYYTWHFTLVGGVSKTIVGAVTLLRNK